MKLYIDCNVFGFCSIHNKLFVLICVKNKTIGLSKCICLLCYLLHIAIWQNWYSLMGVKQDLLKKSLLKLQCCFSVEIATSIQLGSTLKYDVISTLSQRCCACWVKTPRALAVVAPLGLLFVKTLTNVLLMWSFGNCVLL